MKWLHKGERIIEEWKRLLVPGSEEFSNWADFYFENGEPEKCLQCCDEWILYASDDSAYSAKAYYLHRLERYAEATECYDKGFQFLENGMDGYTQELKEIYDINLSGNFTWRAYCYIKLKKYNEALQDLGRAEALDPGAPYLLRIYGIYFRDTGDVIKAEEYFKRASELLPETEEVN